MMHTPAQTQDRPSLYDLFVDQVDAYVIEPSWVIPMFLDMHLSEFKQALPFFVKAVIKKPHYCIAVSEHLYSEHKHRGEIIDQCQVYDAFFSSFFVDVKEDAVTYLLQRSLPKGYISIFDYAKQYGIQYAFYDFYAFYFDRLAADYIERINNAALNCGHTDFVGYKRKAQKTLFELYLVYERLHGSQYEARYGASLKSYQDIFQMLISEKRKLEDI